MVEEIASPADKMQLFRYRQPSVNISRPWKKSYCVNIINVLLAFIHLSLHPVSVQVPEEMVDIFSSSGVSVPFPNVKSEKRLVCMGARILNPKSQ